jgi:2-polyprenyl-3-methyl-5-hydroxy-6-metoxy-1,4-benzoquinol methylase
MPVKKIINKFVIAALYLAGACRALFQPSKYHIKRGYIHRNSVPHYDDTGRTDEYQKEVYELARLYADQHHYTQVLDIGCGSGYKLLQQFPDHDTIGAEVNPTYDFLIKTYPDHKWVNILEQGVLPQQTDLIICADVIEHLIDPDQLIATIKAIDFKLLFISTPERILMTGKYHYGPAYNECHVREWSAAEFHAYIAEHFTVLNHFITDIENATQLLICTKQ